MKLATFCLFNVKSALLYMTTAVPLHVKKQILYQLRNKKNLEKEKETVIKYLKKDGLRFLNSRKHLLK
jgi:hypothetical protein